jgi:hypothetical protein
MKGPANANRWGRNAATETVSPAASKGRQNGRPILEQVSGQEGESVRELHYLQHFVNIDVDAAQYHPDGFIVSDAG